MQHCKKGDRVYFTIGTNQEEGVVESVDYRDDGVAMATIRYELKSNGEISHIHRNVEKLEPVVRLTATSAGKRARAAPGSSLERRQFL
ncbi:uncharacterized protein UTRI_03294 [Ustilago trichophora]|uniref:Hypervirulence associated protein TUDOR domain-containing protein n=1 Tax=Ustilago trichophora TaxID=86804 RepID=A0A5C3E9P9_9BASI|nr:uncharacterized protein UTRI_03294 [Ustilago trichophora]